MYLTNNSGDTMCVPIAAYNVLTHIGESPDLEELAKRVGTNGVRYADTDAFFAEMGWPVAESIESAFRDDARAVIVRVPSNEGWSHIFALIGYKEHGGEIYGLLATNYRKQALVWVPAA